MAVQAPFTYTATLSFPPDKDVANCAIPINYQSNFESSATFTYNLTGSSTRTVDFGTITPNGAKMVQIEVDTDTSPSAQPVMIQFNGGGTAGQVEVAQGGFISIGSPSPTAGGLLSMDLVHATDAVVRVRLLG